MSFFGEDPSVSTESMPALDNSQLVTLRNFLNQMNSSGSVLGGGTTASGTTAGQFVKGYQGPFSAPLSNLENLSLSSLEGMSKDMGSSPIYSQAQQTLSNAMNAKPQDINDYFTNAVENPMLKDFNTKVLPALQGTFAGNNAFGSDKLKATNAVTSQLTDSLASSRSSLALTALQNQQTNALTAANSVAGVTAAPINQQLSLLGGGTVPQQVAQQGVQNQIQDFQTTQSTQQQQIQQMLAALGVKSTDNAAVVNPGSSGSGTSLLTGAAGLAAAFFMA